MSGGRLHTLISVCLLLITCSTAWAEVRETGAGPLDPRGLAEPSPITRRAKSASGAASLAKAAAIWFNETVGVKAVISRSLEQENARIRDSLNSTGQAGVLYRVDIEKTEAEIPFFAVVGGGAHFVGVGTSPYGVHSAAYQLKDDDLRVQPSRGAVLAVDRSYFLWFAKAKVSRDVEATLFPASGVLNETARRLADQKLLERLNIEEGERALNSAVTQMEQNTRSADVKRHIAEMRKRQEETNKRVLEIEAKLQQKLERARKAQAAAQTLSLISTALTLATQIATLKASLGPDAPAGLDAAKSPAELQEIVKRLATVAKERGDEFQLQYRSQTNAARGIRTEYLQLLRQSRYPVNTVPELRKLD